MFAPEGAQRLDGRERWIERLRIEAAPVEAALAGVREEVRLLEETYVLRDRGEGHVKVPGELGDGAALPGDAPEDLPAWPAGERAENTVKNGGTSVNHMVTK